MFAFLSNKRTKPEHFKILSKKNLKKSFLTEVNVVFLINAKFFLTIQRNETNKRKPNKMKKKTTLHTTKPFNSDKV